MVCRFDGEVVGELPVASLVDNCPRYAITPVRPDRLADRRRSTRRATRRPTTSGPTLLTLLAAPNIASKAWVYGQYDQYVGSGSIVRPGADAGVVRLTPSDRAIAVSLDGNGRRVWLDPRARRRRGRLRVGAQRRLHRRQPAAITNCLNFGNPERGETPYMLTEAIEGIAEACEAFGIPSSRATCRSTTRTPRRPIPPTPTVGCLGVLDSRRRRPCRPASGPPATSCCCGDGAPSLDGSEYQRTVHGRVEGRIADRDPAADRGALRARSPTPPARGILRSAHDVSDGGLAVTHRRVRVPGSAAMSSCPTCAGRADVTLFGEGVSAAVVSCAPADEAAVDRARRRPRSAPSPAGPHRRSPARDARIDVATAAADGRPRRHASHRRWPADVRRLRHLRARPRRRPADLLRALRPAAPRPGVGRHRHRRRPPHHRAEGARASSRRSSTRPASRRSGGLSAIGHTRYSTTGSSRWPNAQPVMRHRRAAPSRSATTATSPTPPSCAPSSPSAACASRRRPTPR